MVSSSTPQITDGSNDNSSSSEDSVPPRNERRPFQEQRRSFELRMLHRTASRREHTQYEWFEISGMLRLADACRNSESNANRANHRGKNIHGDSEHPREFYSQCTYIHCSRMSHRFKTVALSRRTAYLSIGICNAKVQVASMLPFHHETA